MTTSTVASGPLLELSCAHVLSRTLHVVAELGIADLLDDQPRTVVELAGETSCATDPLHRMLRLLESNGIFRLDVEGRWRHTDLSRALSSDDPGSHRGFVRMAGSSFSWGSFTGLMHSVRTGEPGICRLDPGGPWSYLQGHPDELAIFQQAMADKSRADVAAALEVHDFSRYGCLVDVAGGSGHLVRAVVEAHPATRGVLFELPEVASRLTAADGVDVVPGDFFTDPLPGGDAYVLMNIIHDWEDPEAVTILEAVASAAAARNARVLLLEAVLPDDATRHWAKTLDVMMLALTGGRERTLDAYEALLGKAGLGLVSISPTATSFSVIEAAPRPL